MSTNVHRVFTVVTTSDYKKECKVYPFPPRRFSEKERNQELEILSIP
jgi:hypothetical protein